MKIRVWDEDRKVMYLHPRSYHIMVDVNGNIKAWNYKRSGSVQHLKILQYIDICDSEGVQYASGDLIELNEGEFYYLHYNGVEYYFAEVGDSDNEGFICDHDSFKIIGNIYENPEMLEEGYVYEL